MKKILFYISYVFGENAAVRHFFVKEIVVKMLANDKIKLLKFPFYFKNV